MSFATRFPSVARLLASAALLGGAPAPNAGDDVDDVDAEAPTGGASAIDQAKLQAAFEKDGNALVAAERARWNAVLESDEGQANVAAACAMLHDTDLSNEAIVKTLGRMGTAAAPKPGARDAARERLRTDEDVDIDTGGGAGGRGADRGGGGDKPSADERKARRKKVQDDRNAAAAARGGVRVGGGSAKSE